MNLIRRLFGKAKNFEYLMRSSSRIHAHLVIDYSLFRNKGKVYILYETPSKKKYLIPEKIPFDNTACPEYLEDAIDSALIRLNTRNNIFKQEYNGEILLDDRIFINKGLRRYTDDKTRKIIRTKVFDAITCPAEY